MRSTYHLCLASHDEVMHRSEEDFVYDVNCFALATYRTESRALADAIMSTHVHFCIQSDDYQAFAFHRRNAYTRYFNAKYGRRGRLGEVRHFVNKLEGIQHIVAAISYVNRNPLHHGLTTTPFGYPYCSSNAVFRKELGKEESVVLYCRKDRRHLSLPRNNPLPSSFRMDTSGMVLHEDIIDARYVEELYVTSRSFLFMMNRYSNEEWIQEQRADGNASAPAVTLDMIEQALPEESTMRMRSNEKGRVFQSVLTDLELCRIIDTEYVPQYRKHSVYSLSSFEKAEIGNTLSLKYGHRTNEKQLKRCLVI